MTTYSGNASSSFGYVQCPGGPPPAGKIIDASRYFVWQHYMDFLNRDPFDPSRPDVAGLDFWRGEISQCGYDFDCIARKRVDVARAFFYADEFIRTVPLLANGSRCTVSYNKEFVRQCYYRYLLRDRDPEVDDPAGFNFWVTKLNDQCPTMGDGAYNEMLRAFILSTEYRNRFRPTPPCRGRGGQDSFARSDMRTNKEHRRSTASIRGSMSKAAFALFAVSTIGVAFVIGQEAGGRAARDRTANARMREWAAKHFPSLVKPAFAKLDLARMLPELNDSPEKLKAPFKVGEAVNFRLLITSNSGGEIHLPIAGTYEHNRPRLLKSGETVPYRPDVEKLLEGVDALRGYASIRYAQLETGNTLTEVVRLSDWYEPLQPGLYRLIVRHRFILGGDWVDSPPLDFEVVR